MFILDVAEAKRTHDNLWLDLGNTTLTPDEWQTKLTTLVALNWMTNNKATKLMDMQRRFHRPVKAIYNRTSFVDLMRTFETVDVCLGPRNAAYIIPAGAWAELDKRADDMAADNPEQGYSNFMDKLKAMYFGSTWN